MADSKHALRPRRRLPDLRGAVLPLAFLLAWEVATRWNWVDTRLIVPPAAVAAEAWAWVIDGRLVAGLSASLARDLAGFVLGGVAGVGIGLLIGMSRWADAIAGPTFHTLKHISLFAWLPLLSAFFGREDLAKVVFIALSAVYPVALGTIEGVKSISRSQFEVARVYGLGRIQTLCKLVLPAASPQMLSGLHLALIYAWLATIGGEYLLRGPGEGIGSTVIRGQASFRVDLIIFGMLLIGGVGALLNQVALRVEARLLRWRAPNHASA